MTKLASKTCKPCSGEVPPLTGKELAALVKQVPKWKVVDRHHITRAFKFPDFLKALAFVNKVDMGHDLVVAVLSAALGQVCVSRSAEERRSQALWCA